MRKNLASRAFGWLPLILVLGSGCSLVYDLSPDQCGANSDCDHFGPNLTCQTGLCVCLAGHACSAVTTTGGTGGKGGSGGTGGTTGGTLSTGGDAGMAPETGGTSAVGGGGTGGSTGGTSGKGGKGGTGARGGTTSTGGTSPEGGAAGMSDSCTTHADCFITHTDDSDPYVCVNSECVELKTKDCPVVLPLSENGVWNALKSRNAVILGGFAPLNNGLPEVVTRNYDLAVSEMNTKTNGGIFPGSSTRRGIVMSVCNDLFAVQADLLVPAKHLMEELQVPGVVSALLLADQQYLFEQVAQPNNVFMMMPLYSDQALIDLPDDGLVWHMLSGADALSVSYQPLVDLTIEQMKKVGSLGAAEDLKLEMVKATDEAFLADTSAYLEANLQYNGKSVADNAKDNLYNPIDVKSSYFDGSDPQTAAISSILNFAPHLVIGNTVSEMLKWIIPGVESGWDAKNPGRARPFYILGALDYNDPQMPTLIQADDSLLLHPPQIVLSQRILGLNWPAAVDQTVNDAYQLRYQSAYGQSFPGYENFYDSTYYLLYALAASRVPLTGSSLVTGMARVTKGTTEVDVGPNDAMVQYVNQFKTDTNVKIKVVGAMGPPNWDAFGARNDAGSVWCLKSNGDYVPDQLRYDSSSSMLVGTSCFTP